MAAVNVRHALALDRVLLVVANAPWQKGGRVMAAAADRFAVVEAAVRDVDGLEASRLEIDRGGESVTADTLEHLAAESPADQLFLVVGADVAAQLHTWRRVEDTRRLATLVVVDRPGPGPEPVAIAALAEAGWRVERVSVPLLDVSSSEIRARAAAGRPLEFLVPAEAIATMRERGLYAGGR